MDTILNMVDRLRWMIALLLAFNALLTGAVILLALRAAALRDEVRDLEAERRGEGHPSPSGDSVDAADSKPDYIEHQGMLAPENAS